MTTASELSAYVKRHIKSGDVPFKGVFASNELPKYNMDDLTSGFSFIANYDPNYKNGSHWIGMIVGKTLNDMMSNRLIQYFDSYGEAPDIDDAVLTDATKFKRYINLIPHTRFMYSDKDYQALDSTVCGLYAAYFILHGLPALNPEAWAGFVVFPKAKIRRGTVSDTNPLGFQNDALIKKLVPIGLEGLFIRQPMPKLETDSPDPVGSGIQAIRFKRELWSPRQAEAWLRQHGHKPIKPVDISLNQLRYRLIEPSQFKNFWYKDTGYDGVSLILGS